VPNAPKPLARAERDRGIAGTRCRRCSRSLYVDEIASLQRDGGEAAVREKLTSLSESERQVLREALAEPEFV
jgi:hypothetical protein